MKDYSNPDLALGIAWYRPEQYSLLLAISTDADGMAHTYDEWLKGVSKTVKELKALGVQSQQVNIDVKELVEWCTQNSKPVDGAARAQFVVHKLNQSFRATSPHEPPLD